MDWISGIQNAINYVESHITEKIIKMLTESGYNAFVKQNDIVSGFL